MLWHGEFYFMITLSFNFAKDTKKANRGAHEQQIRDIVDTHLTFPGSDKLKMGVNIKDNGIASVSFTGPKDTLAEGRRLGREHVKPAAEKVKRVAAKVKRTATRAANPVKRKSVKKSVTKKSASK